ncbi:hypothetical protein HG530_002623 [Fusarium avenaceum]|nr:hypothetical protein HG530_002623 [Fusarium avenaceum]
MVEMRRELRMRKPLFVRDDLLDDLAVVNAAILRDIGDTRLCQGLLETLETPDGIFILDMKGIGLCSDPLLAVLLVDDIAPAKLSQTPLEETGSVLICGSQLADQFIIAREAWLGVQVSRSEPKERHSPFAFILKSFEGTTSTGSREEPQLSPPNDLHRLIANLELAFLRSVVAPRTKAQIRASSSDIVADAAVPLTIQSLAVAEIAAAGKDEQSTCCLPRFFENDGLGDGDDGIVGPEKTAEGPDTMPD